MGQPAGRVGFFCEVDLLFLHQSLFLKEGPMVAKNKPLTTPLTAQGVDRALSPHFQSHVVTPDAFRLFHDTFSYMQMRNAWLQSNPRQASAASL